MTITMTMTTLSAVILIVIIIVFVVWFTCHHIFTALLRPDYEG